MPAGVAPRRAAVHLLHDVLVLGRLLDQQFPHHAGQLPPSDRGLAHALVGAALRNLDGLDELIDSMCRQPLPPDARARQVLRIALAGSLVLNTPDHAVVATALPLVKAGPRRLVHGVLSNLLRRKPELPPAQLPGNWGERWAASWGEAEATLAARQFAEVPATDLSLRDPVATNDWAQKMGAASLLPGHLRLAGSQQIQKLPGFDDGIWWVQDLAASLPARLLGDVRNQQVLDLCAAPGGKTMQLAASGAQVTAVDISATRLHRLRANLSRTGLQAKIITADALQWQPAQAFDHILLDAPCSATGTWRRHPDLLHVKADLDLAPLVELQTALLARAASWLKPGGQLVYAVCSMERAEGEDIAVPDLLRPDPIQPEGLPAQLRAAISGHQLRTLPSTFADDGGADGFFIARYRRL